MHVAIAMHACKVFKYSIANYVFESNGEVSSNSHNMDITVINACSKLCGHNDLSTS